MIGHSATEPRLDLRATLSSASVADLADGNSLTFNADFIAGNVMAGQTGSIDASRYFRGDHGNHLLWLDDSYVGANGLHPNQAGGL